MNDNWVISYTDVIIAVCTYKRPMMLRACLESLRTQGAAVIVVNNDPHTQDLGLLPGNPVVVHETKRGIASARNRALQEAVGRGYRYIAFIDDDETADDEWLANLVFVADTHACAAVTGPVAYAYPDDAPDYKRRTTHATVRYEENSTRPRCATNNLLLDLNQVLPMHLWFDDACNLSGGEDTRFTAQLVARGGEIRWTNFARVTETVPAERLTLRAHVKRSYHKGQHTVQTAELLGRAKPARLMLKASRRALMGLVALVLVMVLGVATETTGVFRQAVGKLAYSGCRRVAEAVGVLSGLLGRRSSFYAVTTGF